MAKRLQGKDFEKAEAFVKDELQHRENSDFRRDHERVWKEVDRQVQMKPMERRYRNQQARKADWRAALELGELAKASEILSDDVRRLVFPNNRSWFDPHSELDFPLSPETGEPTVNHKLQDRVDKGLQAFMAQQHIDFGLEDRAELSIKEALHHGGYVVEAEWQNALKIHDGTGVERVSAPVWVPHSMWDCYPDPSPSIQGTNMFYPGSMIIKSKLKRENLKRMKKGEGYFPSRIDKVPKKNPRDDIELITFHGTLIIERSGDDLILPNSKTVLANDTLIYHMRNPMPFPSIIYHGWEKLDVRDPYYVSPLIKMSPLQKMGSRLASRLMDNIDLKIEPPVIYSSQDPEFAANGGPVIEPGAKSGTQGKAEWKTFDAGDPQSALAGLELVITQIQAGTGVDNVRSGKSEAIEQTATEILKISQGGERRAVDFVGKFEQHGLRPFLVMQHELNKRNLKFYQFYNPNPGAPDFERITARDLPDQVSFEITGSKGVLGEEQRQAQIIQAAQITSQIPQLAALQNWEQIGRQIWQDMGVKDVESFVTQDAQVQALQQQAQQAIEQLESQIAQLQQELQGKALQDDEHQLELEQARSRIEQRDLQKEQKDTRIQELQATLNLLRRGLNGQGRTETTP